MADQSHEHFGRKHRAIVLFTLCHDLQQYRAGNVIAGLRVLDFDIDAGVDKVPNLVQGHIAFLRRIV